MITTKRAISFDAASLSRFQRISIERARRVVRRARAVAGKNVRSSLRRKNRSRLRAMFFSLNASETVYACWSDACRVARAYYYYYYCCWTVVVFIALRFVGLINFTLFNSSNDFEILYTYGVGPIACIIAVFNQIYSISNNARAFSKNRSR